MADVSQAVETQLKNIQLKTGKSLDELTVLVRNSGLTKHSEVREMLQRETGLGYGDANALVHYVFQSDGERAAQARGSSTADVVDEIYSGTKANLRPIHDRLMSSIQSLGEFEIAPKKGYISLRRKKQFVMIGPGTKSRVDVGINMKGYEPTERLLAMPAGSMCQYQVKIADVKEVDDELMGWIRFAYENAG